jgi:hypothetical protein
VASVCKPPYPRAYAVLRFRAWLVLSFLLLGTRVTAVRAQERILGGGFDGIDCRGRNGGHRSIRGHVVQDGSGYYHGFLVTDC